MDNTRHNAVINLVDNRLQVLHGDASILDTLTDRYDIVAANINRNILLQDMPRFREKMTKNAYLILSGFYTNDIPLINDKAMSLGLKMVSQKEENGWACLLLTTK